MTALDVDDLAVVTGPLTLDGHLGNVGLIEGEVVQIKEFDEDGFPWCWGLESELHQYIDRSSLTPLSEIQNDPAVQWGDLLDPNYVHDYVYEGEDE